MAALFSPYATSGTHYQPVASPGDVRYRNATANADLLSATSSLKGDARRHTTYAAATPRCTVCHVC